MVTVIDGWLQVKGNVSKHSVICQKDRGLPPLSSIAPETGIERVLVPATIPERFDAYKYHLTTTAKKLGLRVEEMQGYITRLNRAIYS